MGVLLASDRFHSHRARAKPGPPRARRRSAWRPPPRRARRPSRARAPAAAARRARRSRRRPRRSRRPRLRRAASPAWPACRPWPWRTCAACRRARTPDPRCAWARALAAPAGRACPSLVTVGGLRRLLRRLGARLSRCRPGLQGRGPRLRTRAACEHARALLAPVAWAGTGACMQTCPVGSLAASLGAGRWSRDKRLHANAPGRGPGRVRGRRGGAGGGAAGRRGRRCRRRARRARAPAGGRRARAPGGRGEQPRGARGAQQLQVLRMQAGAPAARFRARPCARPRRPSAPAPRCQGREHARHARRAQKPARSASRHIAARARAHVRAGPPTSVSRSWAPEAGAEGRDRRPSGAPGRRADALPGGHAAGAVRRLPALVSPGVPGRRLARPARGRVDVPQGAPLPLPRRPTPRCSSRACARVLHGPCELLSVARGWTLRAARTLTCHPSVMRASGGDCAAVRGAAAAGGAAAGGAGGAATRRDRAVRPRARPRPRATLLACAPRALPLERRAARARQPRGPQPSALRDAPDAASAAVRSQAVGYLCCPARHAPCQAAAEACC